jgi:hypothetical protein
MSTIDLLAVVVASVAAFIASIIWYIAFGRQWRTLSAGTQPALDDNMRRPQPPRMLVEVLRNLVLTLVLDYLFVHIGAVDWKVALQLGFMLWIAFPVLLLAGSMLRENYPWKLAAIHAGDWLVKLALMSVVLGVWLQ